MNYEKSCGAVVFTRIDNNIKYLLIQNLEGVYGFPKGHVEEGETLIECAVRETEEEIKRKVKSKERREKVKIPESEVEESG